MPKNSRLRGTFEKQDGKRAQTLEIITTARLPHLLINVKAIELEKVSLSDMKNLRTVSEHIDCR